MTCGKTLIYRKDDWKPNRYPTALQMAMDLCDSVTNSNPQSLFWGELNLNFVTSSNITSLPVIIDLVNWMSADLDTQHTWAPFHGGI